MTEMILLTMEEVNDGEEYKRQGDVKSFKILA